MAFDKNRIRRKLLEIKNKGSVDYYSPPKEGKDTIRVIPYPHGEDPFLEYYFHYNIGKNSYICPKKSGVADECPICDLANKLYNSPNDQDKEISKKIYAKLRFYAVVLDRADKSYQTKYWGFSQAIYVKFLTWLQEEDGENDNFLDLDSGLDLVVGLEQTPGKLYPATEIELKRRESPLAPSKEKIEEIVNSVKRADEIFTVLSAAELQQKLDEWANVSDELNDGEEDPFANQPVDTNAVTKEAAPKKEKPTADKLSSKIDKAFENAFPD